MGQLFHDFTVTFAVTILRYFLIAGIAFGLFYYGLAKKLGKAKIQQRYAKNRDFIREIMHSSVSSVMLAIMAVIALSGWLRPYTLVYEELGDYPYWWIPLSLVLSLVVHDTYFYWIHRAMHHERIFRYTHLVHHQSNNPSPWSSYSFHFIEALAEGAVVIVLVLVLPMHPSVILLFTFVSFVINVYGHLGYEIMPKGFRTSIWFEILNSSTYHNLHHQKFKGNYSLYFRVWDRMLKTEHPDYVKIYDRIQEQRFGTKEVSGQDSIELPKEVG